MATTNLIVDFLVVGIAALVWVAPASFFVLGTDWLCVFKDLGVAPASLVVGCLYVGGLSVSRLADDITGRWNDRIRDDVFGRDSRPSYHNRLNMIVVKSGTASDYLSYRRSIVRISRACALNFSLGAVAWAAVAWSRPADVPALGAVLVAGGCAAMFMLMIRAWAVVLKGYFQTVKDMHTYLTQHEDGPAGQE